MYTASVMTVIETCGEFVATAGRIFNVVTATWTIITLPLTAMYIAGLELTLSPHQQVEALVCASTALSFLLFGRSATKASRLANTEGGAIDPHYMPKTRLAKMATPVHFAALTVPPLVYLGALALNKLERPDWMESVSFGDIPESLGTYSTRAHIGVAIRALACAGSIALAQANRSILAYLGKQFHFIGVREKQPQIVSTGPYSIVRHPLYSGVLLQQIMFAAMFWSYIPLVTLGITAAAFVVKIPVEESLMIDHPLLGPEYMEYKVKVPYRIIPYVW